MYAPGAVDWWMQPSNNQLTLSANGATGSPFLTVISTGNVGIGTTSPAYRLDVTGGGVIVRSSMTLSAMPAPPPSAANAGAIYFDSTSRQFMVSQNAGPYYPLGGQTGGGWTEGSGTVQLSTPTDRVGVGASPGTGIKLDVTGDVNASAAYEIGGSTVVSVSGTENVFIGVNAGTSATTGALNAVVGYQAGASLTTTGQNAILGARAGYSTTGYYNVFIGDQAGYQDTTGGSNVFIGEAAGYAATTGGNDILLGYYAGGQGNLTGSANVFVGTEAGFNTSTGGNNVFLGDYAGDNNTSGSGNVFIGYEAGYHSATASNNIFVGNIAGFNATGDYNVFVGQYAGQSQTTGFNNTFLGYQAGYDNVTGADDTAVGFFAGQGLTSGVFNTFLGERAGQSASTASSNTFVGYDAGQTDSTGSGNVFLGFNAGNSETGSNKLYIANTNTASPLIWGDFNAATLDFNAAVGIGTTSPAGRLHVLNPTYFNGMDIIGGNFSVGGTDFASPWSTTDQASIGLIGVGNYRGSSEVFPLTADYPLGAYGSAGLMGLSYQSNGGGGSYTHGVVGYAKSKQTSGLTAGVYGGMFISAADTGSAASGETYYGVYGLADSTPATSDTNGTLYGLFGHASGQSSDTTYGLYAYGSGGTTNFGVYSAGGTNYFNGNVGVGTTNPTAKLHVLDTGNTTTGGLLLQGSGTGGASAANALRLFAAGSPNAGNILFGDGTGWKLNFGKNSDDGATKFVTIQDNGSVGIGTTNPAQTLEVKGGLTISGAGPSSTNSAVNILRFYQTGNNILRFNGQGNSTDPLFYEPSGTSDLRFAKTDGTTTTDLVTISNGGSVGIGTTNPGATLDVNGAVKPEGGIVGSSTNDSASAGYVGEFVSSTVAHGAERGAASGIWGNAAQITLTAGDWDVSGVGVVDCAGACTYTTGSFGVAISAYSGNTATDHVDGDNSAYCGDYSGNEQSCSIPPWRFSLSSTTTLYLKVTANYSSSAPYISGRISARRMR